MEESGRDNPPLPKKREIDSSIPTENNSNSHSKVIISSDSVIKERIVIDFSKVLGIHNID